VASGQRDLLVVPFFEANDWSALDLGTAPKAANGTTDLAVAEGGDALRQALIVRLLTPLGSLGPLGHAGFGSRLHELIGRLSTPETRQLARSYVIQAIAEERRVKKILDIQVETPLQENQDRLRIFVRVEPALELEAVALGIEVAL
jgi:phage gp46-like protein